MYKTITEVDVQLLRKQSTAIHYFGLGFIQIKLGQTYRMHFYTDTLPVLVGEEEVHTHRYDFTSHVLSGLLHQEIFLLTKDDTHSCEAESCKEGVVSNREPFSCGIRSITKQLFSEGSSYSICHDVFHKVKGSEAITLLERTPAIKEYAEVVRRKEAPLVCPFSKKVPEELLWDTVILMLAKAQGKVEF
jgi:hypothetical protein